MGMVPLAWYSGESQRSGFDRVDEAAERLDEVPGDERGGAHAEGEGAVPGAGADGEGEETVEQGDETGAGARRGDVCCCDVEVDERAHGQDHDCGQQGEGGDTGSERDGLLGDDAGPSQREREFKVEGAALLRAGEGRGAVADGEDRDEQRAG